MDLVIRNARLADRPAHELTDIGVAGGRIVGSGRDLPGRD
jgi:dihydroorotase-like cyclic amidohydrolase